MRAAVAVLLACLATADAWASPSAQPFHLRNGDRVVFYGDSITAQRLYTTFAETFVATRFPDLNIGFINSGCGGDKVSGGACGLIDARLRRDVFAHQPTVIVVMLGMNDGSYRAFQEKEFRTYVRGFLHILESAKRALPAARLTIMTPSPYDEVTRPPLFKGGYNSVLLKYGNFLSHCASRSGRRLVDINTKLLVVLKKANTVDPDLAAQMIPDSVHPGAACQLLMAGELLKAWNAPALVASVEIDAANKNIVSTGTTLSNPRYGRALFWDQLDQVLPMPVNWSDQVTALAIRSSDFIETLNAHRLRVTGLSEPRYQLVIDGAAVGHFSREQLGTGINLANLTTPMSRQAEQVHRLTIEHSSLSVAHWQSISGMSDFPQASIQKAVKEVSAAFVVEEAKLLKRRRDVARPVTHRFQLSPD